MFGLRKFSITTLLGAVTLTLGIAATATASAHDHGGLHPGGGFHPGHPGGGFHHGWEHDHWRRGFWGPGFGIGLIAAGYGGCFAYRSIYDPDGNVVGQRLVNVCE